MKPRNPVEAKAHGAWLGAGTGVGLAQAAVAVIQAITGHPLAQGYVTGIYVLAGPLLAFIGAYLAPHTSRQGAVTGTLTDVVRNQSGQLTFTVPDPAGMPPAPRDAPVTTSGSVTP